MKSPASGRTVVGFRLRRGAALLLAAVLASALLPGPSRASDAERWGLYLRLGVGPFVVFTDSDSAPAMGLENPSGEAVGNFALGVDLTPHWGIEVAGDLTETRARSPDAGSFGEIAIWTVTGQVRYRYPVWDERLVPYVSLGGGLGWAEFNDRKVPFGEFPAAGSQESTPIGTVVGGLDYFVNPHVALGLEARYLWAFETAPVRLDGVRQDVTFDSLVPTAGIRVYF